MNPIVPTEQRQIEFYGTELIALRNEAGEVWVPLRRLCDAIGVAFSSQLSRITSDPVLSEQLQTAPVTLPDGRTYEMECLSLKYVRAWLFSINANRVKADIRERLIQYQREVIEIIDRAFSPPVPKSDLSDTFMELMQENARQQMELWAALRTEKVRLQAAEGLLQEHEELLMEHERHLWKHDVTFQEAFEELAALRQQQSRFLARFNDLTRLLPVSSDTISPAQKAAVKELVDDIVAAAQERGVRLGQGRNDYPAVWGALKQRFDVAKYDELTVVQYEEAMQWLKAWLDRIRA